MRTLVRNRRKERAAYPQAEARRRKRRAANVNCRRWVDRAAYFLEEAQVAADRANLFGWMTEPGAKGVSPENVAQAQGMRDLEHALAQRADDCLAEAQRWEKANPL